jgi:hypothetical protein
MATMTDPVTQAEDVIRRSRRRRNGVIFVLALVLGLLITGVVGGGGKAKAATCPAGQHETVSKYAGTICADDLGVAGHDIATVATGGAIGAFGGPSGIFIGLLGGVVAVVIEHTP